MRKEDGHITDTVLFEGMTSVRAVISANEAGFNDRKIIRILADKSRACAHEKELSWLSHRADDMGFTIDMVEPEVLDSLTTGSTHGGIAAECSDRTIPELEAGCLKEDGFYALLEGIEDPYNFGYAVRSLYACGADGIVLTPRNWMSAGGVVCRSSAGASELLPCFVSEQDTVGDIFHSRGYRILSAGIRDSVSSFECSMKKPLLLVIGGEKRGISRTLLSASDETVRIDYGRSFRGSLSAASAAAVLGYEVMRQNR